MGYSLERTIDLGAEGVGISGHFTQSLTHARQVTHYWIITLAFFFTFYIETGVHPIAQAETTHTLPTQADLEFVSLSLLLVSQSHRQP